MRLTACAHAHAHAPLAWCGRLHSPTTVHGSGRTCEANADTEEGDGWVCRAKVHDGDQRCGGPDACDGATTFAIIIRWFLI